MKEYIEKQLRLIHLFAQQHGIDVESAAKLWVSSGLAERYNKMYGDMYF